MALVITGQSKCPLCGEVLMKEDAIRALPPISNTQHPLWEYFDAGFHARCFEQWSAKEEALQLAKEEKQKFIDSADFKEMVTKYGKPAWLDE